VKLFLLISILLLANISVGQDSINQKDANGKKVGAWKIQAKQKNLVGFNPEEICEEGNYKSGRKSGLWTRYYPGHRLKAKITYKNGRVGGKFWTYYENGMIEESGNLNGRNYIDTFQRFNRFGNLTMYKIFDQSGRIVTTWFEGMVPKPMMNNYKFYFKVDTSFNPAGNIDTITAFYPTGCIAEWIVYDNNQREVRHERYKNNCDTSRYLRGEYASAYLQDKRGSPIIPPPPPIIKPPRSEARDGFNMIYNKNKDIYMDGIFKNSKLKNGKLYIYDSDGLLESIQIYKDFKYVGDAAIED
jgi:antitoxin component YwqK of YwqJK toxin-antitoxin module